MPIDFNFQVTPNFRDLSHTGLVLLGQPIVRSLRKIRRLREGKAIPDGPLQRTAKAFLGTR